MLNSLIYSTSCVSLCSYMAYYIFLHAAILSVKFYYILLFECHLHSFVYSLLNLSVHSTYEWLWHPFPCVVAYYNSLYECLKLSFVCSLLFYILLHSVVWQPCTFLHYFVWKPITFLFLTAYYISLSGLLHIYYFVWQRITFLFLTAYDISLSSLLYVCIFLHRQPITFLCLAYYCVHYYVHYFVWKLITFFHLTAYSISLSGLIVSFF